MKKTPQEIEVLREGGRILARITRELGEMVRAGISTGEIDAVAEEKIRAIGGRPSFKGYGRPPFPATICASINEELVHGIPSKKRILKEGDIFTIDIGMQYPAKGGYFTDHARTFAVGKISNEAKHLLLATEEALRRGIAATKVGGTVSDIGKAVEAYATKEGLSVVREYVGHGVGYAVHEEPRVPNYYDPSEPAVPLKEGMVLAIEPMTSVGDAHVQVADDRWTVVMSDGSLCAQFEHTIVVGDKGAEILTKE